MSSNAGAGRGGAVVVIGASFAGLFAAAAAAKAGRQVTVLERDRLPTEAAPRPGVPQSEQPHVLLRRGFLATESLLPGLQQDLLDHGGIRFNTGQMPWLSEYGWMPITELSYEITSLSRPLVELLVRKRVRALPGLTLREEARVSSLNRAGDLWEVHCQDGSLVRANVVIDASGRGSRLPHWLAALGLDVAEPSVVEAKLGYACRPYRGSAPLRTGIVVAATPETMAGALVLPVEDGRWLVCGAGYGERRPGREIEEFEAFLATIRDPVFAQLISTLEPMGGVAIHRQTANRRFAYGESRNWPSGLLVVGDAFCAFNPIYGQGITVAACQAELLAAELPKVTDARSTRRLQRRLGAVADLPWSVATSEDLRMPTSPGRQTALQRLSGRWTTRMVRLAAAGDETCIRAFGRVYHLMGSPLLLFHPGVVFAVMRSLVRGIPPASPRPAVLDLIKQAAGPSTGSGTVS
jgi:2-polyprenyl-6-methoxyphenol hydroxylase-like FAD-dependent oxidoreductase